MSKSELKRLVVMGHPETVVEGLMKKMTTGDTVLIQAIELINALDWLTKQRFDKLESQAFFWNHGSRRERLKSIVEASKS